MNIKTQKEFNELLNEALGGSYKAQGILKEAITTSDIPGLFARVANAELEDQYPVQEPVWKKFASSVELNDFRPTAFYELLPDSSTLLADNGGITVPAGTLPRVPELTPYPTYEFRAGEKFAKTAKNGVRIHFSFEAFINDEWDQIASLPAEATQLAINTEDALATSMLITTSGVNAANFNLANGNILTARTAVVGDITEPGTSTPDNAPLSLDALYAGIAQIKEQKVNGRPVQVQKLALVVPSNLVQYANLLVNAAVVRQTVAGREYEISNPLPAQLEVVENPWLNTIGGTAASTAWFLVPFGGRAGTRRTIVETFLRGRGTPELRVSGQTGRYLGGGEVPFTEGSFDNDDAEMRLRHIVGTGFLNAAGTLASKGDGTAAA